VPSPSWSSSPQRVAAFLYHFSILVNKPASPLPLMLFYLYHLLLYLTHATGNVVYVICSYKKCVSLARSYLNKRCFKNLHKESPFLI
jgi:hypothetical protein